MKYYLGIDGGGTRTTAAVADETGRILLKKAGKTINFYAVGMQKANENLRRLMEQVYCDIGCEKLEAAFIGCSALDGIADEKLTNELCADAVNAEKIIMHSDVYIALKGFDGGCCPCIAICGTGSMAIALDSSGNEHIAGGWGHILGDEGSGYTIALSALKLCCELSDRHISSPLLTAAQKYFGIDDFRKIIDIIYSPEISKDTVAGFAAAVGELAHSGDEGAQQIILQQANAFAETVLALLDQTKKCTCLGLYGGVFKHNELFMAQFTARIHSCYPELKTALLTTPPEESAAALAIKIAKGS